MEETGCKSKKTLKKMIFFIYFSILSFVCKTPIIQSVYNQGKIIVFVNLHP